jgi:hypothetical protein
MFRHVMGLESDHSPQNLRPDFEQQPVQTIWILLALAITWSWAEHFLI